MGSNPGYLPKYFLLYPEALRSSPLLASDETFETDYIYFHDISNQSDINQKTKKVG